VPRSILLGRQRKSVTTYEYDENGRLVRSVTVHDPEWTEEDYGWAAAEESNRAALCPGGCGHPLEETIDPDIEWEAPLPVVCFACRTLAKRQAEYQRPDVEPGHLFHVQRKR